MRLLLVAYYFPPLASAGTFRALRLAKHLPRSGFALTVVTVVPRVRLLKDEDLVRDVPASVTVCRTSTLEPRNVFLAMGKLGLGRLARRAASWLMLPDDQRGWVPFALAAAKREHAAAPFDAVVTTSAPYSAHLVGRALRREGIPWLADFRDEWTTNPYVRTHYPTAAHLRYCQALERAVLREADCVSTVSEPCLAGLRRGSPDLADDKFVLLPNGYDAEHFPAGAPGPPDRFRIVYTGTFYGHHSPAVFLEAVRRLLAQGRIRAEDLDVVLVGHSPGLAALRGPLPPGVRVLPHVPHHQAVRLMREAAVLLLVSAGAAGPGIYTTKLFEYLAARRPILSLAPPGVAADLLRRTRAGVTVSPDDPDAVAEALAGLHLAWARGGIPHDPDLQEIARYEATQQAADWAGALKRMVELSPAAAASRRRRAPARS